VVYTQTIPRDPSDFFYSRLGNPTRSVLEECLASIEGSKHALAFASGISAITAVIATLSTGDGIICSKHFYSGTLDSMLIAEQMGIDVQYIDFTDLKNLEAAMKPNTKIVWTEPLMNPTMAVIDIKSAAAIAHKKSPNAIVLVDNTFLTPYYQRPLELGADIALYSLTKYFSGHSDVLGGSLACNDDKIYAALRKSQGATGTMAQPFEAYLIIRSVKTLSIRMERHAENSFAVAKWLETHPKVGKVNHPALKSHAGHEIAIKQAYGHSGIFSFYFKEDNYEKTQKFFAALKLIPVCTSLGGVETTVAFPREMSHGRYSDDEVYRMGVTYNLIRISIGIEDVEDIIADLEQALEVV
jgi:cystathionine gamma-lyase